MYIISFYEINYHLIFFRVCAFLGTEEEEEVEVEYFVSAVPVATHIITFFVSLNVTSTPEIIVTSGYMVSAFFINSSIIIISLLESS